MSNISFNQKPDGWKRYITVEYVRQTVASLHHIVHQTFDQTSGRGIIGVHLQRFLPVKVTFTFLSSQFQDLW